MTIRRLHRKNEIKTPRRMSSGSTTSQIISARGRAYVGTSQAWSVGFLYFFPMINHEGYNRLFGNSHNIRVTTAGTAGSVAHAGVYTSQSFANRHRPGALIRSTSVSIDTVGTKSFSGLIGPVPPGLIWMAFLHTSTATMNTDYNLIYDATSQASATGTVLNTFFASGQSPPLPDDASGLSLSILSSLLNLMPFNVNPITS